MEIIKNKRLIMDLNGKRILITGASSGLGRELAYQFSRKGNVDLILVARRKEALDKVAKKCESLGKVTTETYSVDMSSQEEVEGLLQNVSEIDILINNAGIIKRIPMTDMSVDEFNSVIDVDLIAPFIMAKAVLPNMVKRRSGKIINICSMMSELGRETVSAYAAAKGGLKMLTKNIASEYGQYNIQCNGIGPGYIATSHTAPLRKIQPDGSKHPFDSFILAKTPANRWGDPADLAGPVVFLSSPASDFVNGHILYVDGGILAYIGKQP